jgi:hypothetical protein
VEVYALLSWYVHTGATGTAGMGKDAIESVFGVSHVLIRRIFLDAIDVCAKATKISELAEYPGWMRGLEMKTAELIVSEANSESYSTRNARKPHPRKPLSAGFTIPRQPHPLVSLCGIEAQAQ